MKGLRSADGNYSNMSVLPDVGQCKVVKIFQSSNLGKICQTKIEVNFHKHQDNLSNKLRFIFQNTRIILAKFVKVYRGETDLMCRGLSTPRDIILIERQS